jgi:hypothetical protein
MKTNNSLDFSIQNCGKLSDYVLNLGFKRFVPLAEYVRALGYGRTSNSQDILAVVREQKGTCGSKHLLLASLAHECGHTDIQLMVGIYQMCEDNTPGVGEVLERAGLKSIPEAHCYLRYKDSRYDFTGLKNGISSPFDSLSLEQVVTPSDLAEVKNTLHRQEIGKFARRLKLDPDAVWRIREACIKVLSEKWIN